MECDKGNCFSTLFFCFVLQGLHFVFVHSDRTILVHIIHDSYIVVRTASSKDCSPQTAQILQKIRHSEGMRASWLARGAARTLQLHGTPVAKTDMERFAFGAACQRSFVTTKKSAKGQLVGLNVKVKETRSGTLAKALQLHRAIEMAAKKLPCMGTCVNALVSHYEQYFVYHEVFLEKLHESSFGDGGELFRKEDQDIGKFLYQILRAWHVDRPLHETDEDSYTFQQDWDGGFWDKKWFTIDPSCFPKQKPWVLAIPVGQGAL